MSCSTLAPDEAAALAASRRAARRASMRSCTGEGSVVQPALPLARWAPPAALEPPTSEASASDNASAFSSASASSRPRLCSANPDARRVWCAPVESNVPILSPVGTEPARPAGCVCLSRSARASRLEKRLSGCSNPEPPSPSQSPPFSSSSSLHQLSSHSDESPHSSSLRSLGFAER